MNKREYFLYGFQGFAILLLILFLIHIFNLEKEVRFLRNDINEFRKSSDIKVESLIADVNGLTLTENENNIQIQKSLNSIIQKSENQFLKTVGMKSTYDAILEGQKKMTVGNSEYDTEYLKIKTKAIELFNNKDYVHAYDEFRKALIIKPDDMESRLYKVKSLYMRNKGDSSNYQELLNDIKILEVNGIVDKDCMEIKEMIIQEREGINE